MRFRAPHPWDLTPRQAIAVQRRLSSEIITRDRFGPLRRVAGVDVGVFRRGRVCRAAVVVLSWPELETVAEALATRPVSFPYVPGLLSFRELPAVLAALESLAQPPDLILCDGQGLAHPRRFGLACHLGLVTDIPTVGVAKSRLVGRHRPPGTTRGASTSLLDGDEVIGAVVRTRSGVRPVYVSVGHRVGLESAVALVLQASPRYRLPETTRRAHRLASAGRGPGDSSELPKLDL